MNSVKLIYFEGCPNAKQARAALLVSQVEFSVIRQDELGESDPLRQYSSPTILKGEEIIFGQKLEPNSSACSSEVLDSELIGQKLLDQSPAKPKKGALASIGSFGSAMTVGLCPVCIPAIGAFLSSIGLSFLTTETVLKPVLVVFLVIALSGFFWSYKKEHKNIGPLIGGVLMAIALYVGRYVYVGSTFNVTLMYGGIAGIIGMSIWNLVLRKKARCSACEV